MVFYATHDSGETWVPGPGVIEEGGDKLGGDQPLDIVSAKDIFIWAEPNLLTTHDGAKTWQTLRPNIYFGRNSSVLRVSQLDFVDARSGWVLICDNSSHSPDGTFYLGKTTDGGATWTEQPITIEK